MRKKAVQAILLTWYLGIVSSLLIGGGFDVNSGIPRTIIHSLPCRNPCRLFMHDDNFFGYLGLHLLM